MASEGAKVKYFIDTEFIESGPGASIDLLSIGIVCEDGREFYAESASANLAMANDWVQENVLPHLTGEKILLGPMGDAIKAFIGDARPEFWGYYADYDWVVFCQIFGAMVDLPKGWPMYCRDLKQLCDSLGNPKLPAQISTEHNALNDAKWNKIAYEFLAPAPSPGVTSEPDDKCPKCGSDVQSRCKQKCWHSPHPFHSAIPARDYDFHGNPPNRPARPELDKDEGGSEPEYLDCDCGVDPKHECFLPPWAHAQDCPYRTQKPRDDSSSASGREKGDL